MMRTKALEKMEYDRGCQGGAEPRIGLGMGVCRQV